MKTAYIFIHGNLSKIPSLKEKICQQDLVICADGGAEFALKQDIIPHVIIGDLDSISPSVRKHFEKTKVEWITYPCEKDNTDTDLAIQYAIKMKVDNIIILGLLGDRVDHMISNLFHLSQVTKNIKCQILEGNTTMQFLSDILEIDGAKGDELSIIPLQGDCIGVQTEGLYYPLMNETLPYGTTRGISNVFTGSHVKIILESGLGLVVHRQSIG